VIEEPELEAADIQGNILVGFMKNHQAMLCLRFGETAGAKAWLAELESRIATTEEVLAFAQLRRTLRDRRGSSPIGATWVNVAFSALGLAKLTSAAEVDRFLSKSFVNGMPEDASSLGDRVDEHGRPTGWVFGGIDDVPDAFLIVASDDPTHLAEAVAAEKAALAAPGAPELVHELPCTARADLPGHEHFGFKDGISQPAVRGRVNGSPLSPRRLSPDDEASAVYAEPGRPLVWPGQFVIGLPIQNGDDPLQPMDPQAPAPDWSRNGSYLVVRRLQQDVDGFWRFAREQAAELAQAPGFAGMTAERLASLMVGRWPSGAPTSRTPDAELEALGTDDRANNAFFFRGGSPPKRVEGSPPDPYPPAVADPDGVRCPYAAHIRKVNPRDDGTDTGGLADVFTHAILRRGIAYGEPFHAGEDPPGDRGLMFLCYQSSIANQFRFLTQRWVNQPGLPHGDHGHDPILGQSGRDSERKRWLVVVGTNGEQRTLELPHDFVTATGGGYFFAPSLRAIRDVLAKP
jgi:Dyp-type peroxidase family